MRRTALCVGATGAFFVILAIPTNSRVIVAVGLILIVVAHALLFLSYLPQKALTARSEHPHCVRARGDPETREL